MPASGSKTTRHPRRRGDGKARDQSLREAQRRPRDLRPYPPGGRPPPAAPSPLTSGGTRRPKTVYNVVDASAVGTCGTGAEGDQVRTLHNLGGSLREPRGAISPSLRYCAETLRRLPCRRSGAENRCPVGADTASLVLSRACRGR